MCNRFFQRYTKNDTKNIIEKKSYEQLLLYYFCVYFKKIKMKKIKLLFLLFTVVMLSSCSLTLPVTATSNPIPSNPKVGTSEALSIWGLIIRGDASIMTAAKNGNITKISTIDLKVSKFFFGCGTWKTTVTGE